jgi:hypothetical protein
MASEPLERLYSLVNWQDDLSTGEGRVRYEQIKGEMRQVAEHEWLRSLLSGREAKVLDLCGGAGIAGIAMAKVLADTGRGCTLSIVDLREKALEKARLLGRQELGREPETHVLDVRDLRGLPTKHDVALLWGLTTPHFDPWDMMKAMAGVSGVLSDDGVLVIEEVDRVYLRFTQFGYQRVLVESATEDEAVLSLHAGFDIKTGSFRRLTLDLMDGERRSMDSYYFWGVAPMCQLAWTFFEDVDLIQKDRVRCIILAAGPRRRIEPGVFVGSEPRMLRGSAQNP